MAGRGAGYDPSFLGEKVAASVPLPAPSQTASPIQAPSTPAPPTPAPQTSALQRVTLDYTHFSVILRRDRQLAELTAVNIDGAGLIDLGRGDDWHLDDRVPESDQAGPEVYSGNDLDRGHLVRRRDPVWGPDAAAANFDTFSYTNAAPQASVFNQSKELWLGLEDYLLGIADTTDEKLSVFTGPVLADGDREYRGIRLPEKFFKIAVWMSRGALAATAYLLDQAALLDRIVRPSAAETEPGAYRTFQVSVDDIATLTGFDLDLLAAADRFGTGRAARAGGRIELREYGDIRL